MSTSATDSALQLIIDSAPALIHTARPDGHIDFFNRTWLEYVGLSPEDLLGWKWTAYIHPDDLDGILEKWRASLASGEAFLHETRVRRADGQYRWMLHHKVVLREENGRIVKWYGSSVDIEERKTAEEQFRRNAQELQRSQFYLSEGQRLAYMGSWAFNAAGFDYWSEELFRIYGLHLSGKAPTIEEYMGLVHPEDRDSVSQTIQKMFAEGRGFDFTKRIVRPDGKIRSVRCVGVPSTHGGTSQGFVGTGIDVTEQERILDELKRSEFYLSEGQRLGHAGSWSINPSGFFDYWSRELFQIYGLDLERKAPTIEEYLASVHPQDREFMARTIEKMVAEGLGCDLKKRIVRPGGEVRYIRCVGVPVFDNGILKSIVGTAMDITEQEELTQELRRREAYLAEAQRLSHTGSFGCNLSKGELSWSEETYRIFGCDPHDKPTIQMLLDRIHPRDASSVQPFI